MVQRKRFEAVGEAGQLMVMGSEQGPCPDLVMHRLDHRPGNGQPVIGRGASPDLIEDDKAVRRCLGEDRGGFDHFDHERRAAAGEIVRRADPAEQPVDDADPGARCRDIAAGLGKKRGERHLAEEGRFSAHIRTGDQPEAIIRPERAIIGDELLTLPDQRFLDNRVATGFQLDAWLIHQVRQAPAALGCTRGMTCRDIYPGDGVRCPCNAWCGGYGEAGKLFKMSGLGGQGVGSGFDDAARLGYEGREN